MKPSPAGKSSAEDRGSLWFAAVFGCFLALALLKFSNPPILEQWTTPPKDIYEFLFGSDWPISWAYGLLGAVLLTGLLLSRGAARFPKWLLAAGAAWLVWQFAAAAKSVGPSLSAVTLKHFIACAVCFCLGLFCLARQRNPWPFWLLLFAGLCLVLISGLNQHFGGLKETRQYFYLYQYPKMKEFPPGFLAKMKSDRIFATLFYPNALAGVLLVLLPPLLAVILLSRRLTIPARSFVAVVFGLAGFGCLYWSGSKGGWLLMLLLGLLAMARLPFGRRWKLILISVLVAGGLAAFFLKYAGYFGKGATSVVARFDYWRAAVKISGEHPAFGTGPGTFYIPYMRIKDPRSEPARLTHNDYLEQASDSGIPGFLLYTGFIAAALAMSYPRRAEGWLKYSAWLGVLGFSLQSLVEFSLYLPGLAWPAMALLGWLVGSRHQTPPPVAKT